jgi:hypothetical protein
MYLISTTLALMSKNVGYLLLFYCSKPNRLLSDALKKLKVGEDDEGW